MSLYRDRVPNDAEIAAMANSGWHFNERLMTYERQRGGTVDSSGQEVSPTPYEPAFYDNRDLREHPLGIFGAIEMNGNQITHPKPMERLLEHRKREAEQAAEGQKRLKAKNELPTIPKHQQFAFKNKEGLHNGFTQQELKLQQIYKRQIEEKKELARASRLEQQRTFGGRAVVDNILKALEMMTPDEKAAYKRLLNEGGSKDA